MNVQFKKGILELCVLALASNRDRYGYELVSAISEKFEIAEGTIYPLLRRLTQEQYFSTYLVESREGPPRKYYRLTEQGKTYAQALIQEWRHFERSVDQIIEEGAANDPSTISR